METTEINNADGTEDKTVGAKDKIDVEQQVVQSFPTKKDGGPETPTARNEQAGKVEEPEKVNLLIRRGKPPMSIELDYISSAWQ